MSYDLSEYGDLQYVQPAGHRGIGGCAPLGIVGCRRNLKWGWMPPHPTFYLRRDIYEKTKLTNGEYFDMGFTCAADYDFMMRIFGKYKVEPAYLRMVLVKMRVEGVSNRSIGHMIQKSKEDWAVIRENRIGNIHTPAWKNMAKIGQFFVRLWKCSRACSPMHIGGSAICWIFCLLQEGLCWELLLAGDISS